MRRKPLPNALDIDLRGGLTERVTPHAGVALLIDVMRRSGVAAAAERHLPAKRSAKGLGQGQMIEAFVLLSALGGECLDDLEHLRRDMGLTALTGYPLPAAPTARQWLDRFHEPALLADRPAQGSFMPILGITTPSWAPSCHAGVARPAHLGDRGRQAGPPAHAEECPGRHVTPCGHHRSQRGYGRGTAPSNEAPRATRGAFSRSGVWSGRLDSNQRPLDPQSSALPGCATPRH